jgi:hypothetical protein
MEEILPLETPKVSFVKEESVDTQEARVTVTELTEVSVLPI